MLILAFNSSYKYIAKFVMQLEDNIDYKAEYLKLKETVSVDYGINQLSEIAIEMMQISDELHLYNYISKTVNRIIPNSVVIVTSLSSDEKTSKVEAIDGLSKLMSDKVINILGFPLLEKEFSNDSNQLTNLKTGVLYNHTNGLVDFASGLLKPTIGKALSTLLSISNIYSIGINRKGSLLSAIHIIIRKSGSITDKRFIQLFVNLSKNILHRIRLEKGITVTEQKFRTIFDRSLSSIFIIENGAIVLANDAFQDFIGYDLQTMQSLNPIELIENTYRDQIEVLINNLIDGNSEAAHSTVPFYTKDNGLRWMETTATLINYDGIPKVLVNGRDITQRVKDAAQISKLTTGIDNSPIAVVITDRKGIIEFVNPSFCEITGYDITEVIGLKTSILKSGHHSESFYDNMWKKISNGEVWNNDILNKKKDGSLFWERCRIAPIYDSSDELTNFIAFKEDITQQKETHELLAVSEKELRALNLKKDKFFSIISHDLRSPVSSLLSVTDVLNKKKNIFEKEKTDLLIENVNKSVQHVYKLLENLLVWSRSQTNKIEFNPEVIDIRDIVDESLGLLENNYIAKGITIQIKSKNQPFIFADHNMLFTVIRNLLSNAIKFSYDNSIIEMSCECKGEWLYVSIQDFGTGIPKKRVKTLFDMEYAISTPGTKREKGTGLGLLLCKEFIDMHKGEINVESEEEQGTKITFSIPLVNH